MLLGYRLFRATVALVTAAAMAVAAPVQGLAQSDQVRARVAEAEKGDPQAQFAVGVMHETARHVEQDFAKAAEWYEKAAAQGYGPAQVSLGYLYQTGKGRPHDPVKAADWYRRAAETGDVGGQFHLAVAYINGIGVARNGQQAAQWMFKAADAGDQQAQLIFATMLQTGTGVPANEFAARRWFDKAANGRDRELATKAASMRQKIDDRVLFSGAFRPADIAAVAAIGFGLALLIYAAVPEHARTGPSSDYQWNGYEAPNIYWPGPSARTPVRTPSGFISFKPRPHGYMGDFSVQEARKTNPR